MEQFTLAIKFTATAENYEKFKQELLNLFDTISNEENFVSAILHQNIQKKEEFLVYEIWNDNIDHFINVQLKKPYAIAWEKLLIDMDIKRDPSMYMPIGKFARSSKTLSTVNANQNSEAIKRPEFVLGMDHIGMNVPDIKQAISFFEDVMGFHVVTRLGKLPIDKAWKKRYHIRQSAELEDIVMMRAGNGSSIELFQYKSPQRNMQRPLGDDVGWFHLGFYTDDIYGSVGFLESKGINVLNDPIVVEKGKPNTGETWVYFVTPWGLQIELVNYPSGKAYEKAKPPYVLWSPKDHRD